ncbi:Alpha-adducin, partial [Fasciolopsis buskii]
ALGQRNGVIPINDLRGGDAAVYPRRERSLRCKLASVYRLIDLFGWNTSIYNHVTSRISSKNEHFLINPFGLLYHEITASSLIKVDCKGQILDPGSTVLGVNQTTWMLHSAVHSARADIRCIIHVDTPATIAVSCMKSGLLPLCHETMILGEIAYYTPSIFPGIGNGEQTPDDEHDQLKDWNAERVAVAEALGPTARVLFLRSRGLLALGETVEEAWHYATNAVVACETQLLLASLGVDNLVLPNDKLKQKAYETWRTSGLGGLSGPEAALASRLATAQRLSSTEAGYSSPTEGHTHTESDGASMTIPRPWRLGELEFEAMMRHLDNAGCRTGHLYRQEAMASPHRVRRARTLDNKGYTSQEDEVQIPPAASSTTATMAYFYDDGILSGDETETQRPSTLRRDWTQKQWFNTPNKYTKEVTKPSPAHQPVARWVSEREHAIRKAVSSGALPPPAPFHPLTPAAVPLGSTGGPATGTSSAYTPYNTFAPQGSNPKEFRDQQKKVKSKYYQDTNTAGPQSRLLDGLTWDEARRVRDEGLVKVLGPRGAAMVTQGATTDMPVAAASKAIIQRDIRNAAVIYDGLYSHQNPFEKITDEELEMYRREIELKSHPELAVELERRGMLGPIDTSAQSPPVGDSLAVDSGATDLESASEVGPVLDPSILSPRARTSPTAELVQSRGSHASSHSPPLEQSSPAHLVLPAGTGTLTSEPSGPEEHGDTEDKQKKKKKRFKLPSFSLRSKDKTKEK